ncbi:MAG TPA: hypothetical protein VG265_13565 [Gaiellaceae bacterium]|nr:hypothetical protein [Gaiellaceae bacterium]
MSGLGRIGGVASIDAVLLACGYCVLALPLRRLRAALWASYAGLALLAGAGIVGIELCAVAVAGGKTSPGALEACAAATAVVGLAVRVLRPGWSTPVAAAPRRASPPRSFWALAISTAAGFVLAAVGVIALVGGFRASPWLDDTWTFWAPKGIALDRLGLDHRLFLGADGYLPFAHLDYPWWWSILLGNDLHAAGGVDLRVVDGQLTILVIAFVGTVVRLLWGYVRPTILLPGIALLACSHELLDQTQSGGADLVLAVYLVLFLLGAGFWLRGGEGFWLLVAGLGGAVALQVKTEGLPQLLLFAAVATLFGRQAGARRLLGLWSTVALAFLSAAPFLVWRRIHGLHNDIDYGKALDPSFLFGRTGRVGQASETLARHLLTPTEWLFLVPLVLVLGATLAWRTREPRWLAPAALVVAGFAFWVWVNWADVYPLAYRLATSSYRIIDPIVVAAGVAVPVLAERLAQLRSPDGSPPRATQT